jgi:hypothetical protein
MSRKIDDRTFLTYLLQYLNVNDLKQICRDFNIKGFSKLKKVELIDFILDSLAEEEMVELLEQKEVEIVSEGIDTAINKIRGVDRETIKSIKIVNPEEHEIEILFKGMNWEITSFLSITGNNMSNPERDCDCRIGSNMGLCNHFWVGFIYSLKQDWFKLENWSFTRLPNDFKDNIKSIKISTAQTSGDKSNGASIVDENSDDFQLMGFLNTSITVYEGEITEIEEKQSEFQGNITIYYLTSLKNLKLGPKIARKSDFREEDIKESEELKLRMSQKLHDESGLNNGDKIKFNGKLVKDNMVGLIVKNVRKVEMV